MLILCFCFNCNLSYFQRNLHERIYGKSLALNSLVNPGSQIIESGALLNLRQQQAREAAERNAQKQNQPLVNGKTPFKVGKLFFLSYFI